MRTVKELFVVAYDVTSDKKRRAIAKVLDKYGHRVNASVYECLVTPAESMRMKDAIASAYNPRTDRIVFYRLCLNCFSKAEYLPKREDKASSVLFLN